MNEFLQGFRRCGDDISERCFLWRPGELRDEMGDLGVSRGHSHVLCIEENEAQERLRSLLYSLTASAMDGSGNGKAHLRR